MLPSANISSQWKSFLARIIFPTALTIALFLTAFFAIIIPAIEKSSLDRKREMIRELTNSAWNILAKLQYDEQQGILTQQEAQRLAIEQIRNLHYGQEMKDYFWINDMHPRMIIHPYRPDLTGKDLSDYTDPEGKKIFVEFVNIVRTQGAGYAQYKWQWKDKEDRIEPKISYVKGFSPWGWIIGTGIYIDDVKAEIKALTRNLIEISFFILIIIALLLASMIRQSYQTMKQQQLAEKALRESEEKYRLLVESAGEGMLMALDGKYTHANQTIVNLLGYSPEEFSQMRVYEIFPDSPDLPGNKHVQELSSGRSIPPTFETRLKTKSGSTVDVILSTNEITIGDKTGFIAVVTDITLRKQAEDALGESEEKFRTLANNLNVGIFRRTVGSSPKIIEANPAMVELMGCKDKEELLSTPVSEMYSTLDDRKKYESRFHSDGLKRETVKLKKKDGTVFTASIWGVTVYDDEDKPLYFDGVIEDITDIKMLEDKRVKLLSEMQTALMFFNQPLSSLNFSEVIICDADSVVAETVKMMEQQKTDVLMVQDRQGNNIGVVTDKDIRKCVVNAENFRHTPVSKIMSSPVLSLPLQSHIFESWLFMEQNHISHLFVKDINGKITGVISSEDVVAIQKYSPAVLLWEIQHSNSPEEVVEHSSALPYLVTTLINSGAKPRNITHLTTIIIDTVLQKLLEFAVNELGIPPVKFAFIVFGSEGRMEQTLRTDQDNAIIFEDVNSDLTETVQQYFLKLGSLVCGWLDKAGYHYCDGDNMAQNPQWCQPLSVWKQYFSQWINTGSAEDLLKAKIFFDLRCAYGENELVLDLKTYLNTTTEKTPRFFQLLARNVLPLTPPIGLFGNFVVESVGEKRKAFDIKMSLMPITDFARIYALKHKINETNTLERLNSLREHNALSKQNHQEIVQAFNYLMQIRLQSQADAISSGQRSPDNYVTPQNLTYIEQKLLKEIFSQIKNFQSKLSYEFTGQLGGV